MILINAPITFKKYLIAYCSNLLMVTYYVVPLPQFLHLNVPLQFAIPPGRRLLRLLWPFMGAPVFYCLPGIIISILPPFSQGYSKRALKKRVLLPYRAGFLSRLRHHPSRKYDFLHLKCLFAKVTTSYRCAHCHTYFKKCYFHCSPILAIS